MIKNFIIHIGTHKTGTTSIQKLLLKHELELEEHKTRVIDRKRDLPDVSKWLFPQWYGIEDINQQELIALHQILKVKSQLVNVENLVYSEENFSDELSIDEQLIRAQKLNILIGLFDAQNTQVHVFFREPQSLLFSLYKQLIRNRHFNFVNFNAFADQHITDYSLSSNWTNYTKILSEALDHVILKTHDFETSIENGLTNYFFNTILNQKSINIEDEVYNPSDSSLKIKLLEELSRVAINQKIPTNQIGWIKQAVNNMEISEEISKEHFMLSNNNSHMLNKLKNTSEDT